jgi:hypothetical protein
MYQPSVRGRSAKAVAERQSGCGDRFCDLVFQHFAAVVRDGEVA